MVEDTAQPPGGPQYSDPLPDFQVLRSSDAQGWQGALVHLYRLAPQPDFVPLPQIAAHTLQVLITGAGHRSSVVDGHSSQSYSTPGTIALLPMGLTAAYRWDDTFDVANLYLAPALITTAAATIGRGDPAQIELHPSAATRDALSEHLVAGLLHELETPSPLGRLYANTLVQTLAVHLLHRHSSLVAAPAPRPSRLAPHQLNQVLDYIHTFFATDISLDDLARLVHLSPAYFARQFKQAVGVAPHQYLIQCRVERARALLQAGDKTIMQIALEVGFADHSHLTRHFKRLTGLHPSELLPSRKNIQAERKNVQA